MNKIRIIVNKGGVVETVYASKKLKDVDVEVVDFCTDDSDVLNEVAEAWEEVEKEVHKGRLVEVY